MHNYELPRRDETSVASMRRLFVSTISVIIIGGFSPIYAEQQARIVNGTVVPQGKYPWMVVLLHATEEDNVAARFCGGTLIHRQWVLTAAHCVAGMQRGQIRVSVNQVNLRSPQLERLTIDRIVAHSSYVRGGYRDVALLRLQRRLPASQPVLDVVQANTRIPIHTRVTAMGWGRPRYNEFATDELREAQTRITAPRNCGNNSVLPYKFYQRHELCVLSTNGNQGTCSGDSGGPIVARYRNSRRFYQVGITSWGDSKCDTSVPEVHTNLSDVSSWIARQIKGRSVPGETTDLSKLILDYCNRRHCVFDASFARTELFNVDVVPEYFRWDTDEGDSLSGNSASIFKTRFQRLGRHRVTLTLNLSNGRVLRKTITVAVSLSKRDPDRFPMRKTVYDRDYDDRGYHQPYDVGEERKLFLQAGQGTYFYEGLADFRLTVPPNSNFDLYLYKRTYFSPEWTEIARSDSDSSSVERITLNLGRGYYYLKVRASSGSGTPSLNSRVWRSRRDVALGLQATTEGFLSVRPPKR